jgi:O-antigen/teichoic acid export membrane protein
VRTRKRDTTALAVGSLANGLLAYVFFSLTTWTLGPTLAAPVSVLWAYWSFAGAALTFPLQHWIARSVVAHGGERAVRTALPRVSLAVTGSAGALGVASWTIRGELFHRDDAWFPVLVFLVTMGSGFIGVVRGALTARRRFTSLAWTLAGEGALRCVAALLLIAGGVHSPVAFGFALAAGPVIGLLWPRTLRFSTSGEPATARSHVAFLGGTASGQLLGQTVLTGGPVLLTLSGGTAAQVTALFAALALFRAPYTLAVGLVPQLTGRLTMLVVQGRRMALRRIRLLLLTGTVLAVAAAAATASTIGPALLRIVFGPGVELGGQAILLVAVGSAFALANLAATIMLMARGRAGAVFRAWVAACLAGAVCFVLADLSPLDRTCWAFAVAEAAALVFLVTAEVNGTASLVTPGVVRPA